MKKILTLFTALLLLGSFTVVKATDYYVAHDPNIGGLEWTNNKEKMTAKGDGTYYFTFYAVPASTNAALKITLNGSWDSQINYTNLNTSKSNITFSATDGDNNVKFTTSSVQNITVWTDGTELWVVANDPIIKEEVLNGSKVMFYYGSPTGWGQNTMYFLTSNAKKPWENGYALTGKSHEWKSGYYSTIGLFALNSSTTYYLSNNNDWVGNGKSGLTAGCFADMSANVTGNTSFVCTLGSTSYPITEGDASVAITSTVSGTSGLGLSYSLDHYYISEDGSTWSEFDPTNTSALAEGTYTIKALATDGHIFMASTNSATLTVSAYVPGAHDITATAATKWTYGSLPASQTAGETVEFTVTPDDGYSVEVSSDDVTITKNGNTYSFTMPDNDVAISVVATALSYSISYPASPSHYTLAGGNPTSGNTDATINFTVTPDANYFLTVTVNGDEVEGVNNVYSFTMPAEAVTVDVVANTYRVFDGSTPLYFNAGAVNWWTDASALQKATFTKADNSTVVVSGVLEEGSVYAFTPEAGSYKLVRFSRHDPNGGGQWNTTGEISLIGTEAYDYVSSFAENSADVIWSTFVPAPSYTFTAGTTIYYDFTAYGNGVDMYPGGNHTYQGDMSIVRAFELAADWKVTENTTLFQSAASNWQPVKCTTLPTAGQNMIVSTDGATYSWGTYVPPVNPTVDFVSLGSTIGTGLSVKFAATSTNVDNPVYTFSVKKGSGDYSSAVTSYTFDEAGTYTVKVEVDGDDSKHAEKTQDVTVVDDAHIIYFVNKDAWTQVNAHMWGDDPATVWPGELMTLTAFETSRNHYTVYSITFTPDYTSIIFSNDGATQTPDKGMEEGKSYYYDGDWYATLAECDQPDLRTNFYLAGSFNSWSTTADRFMKATEDATSATVTITISEYSNITMKVMEGTAYCGGETAIDKDHTSVTIEAANSGSDIAMTPYAAGDYIFTLNLTTRELTVTYPSGDPMPVPTNFYLAGTFNGWSTTADRFMKASPDATTASVTINIAEYINITMKVMEGSAYCGGETAIDKDHTSVTIEAANSGSDIAMTPYAAGDYIFTFDLSTRELTVTYPSGDPMPIPQNIYLLGIESWDESDDYKFSVSGDVATLEVENMTALHEYEFKLKYNGAWFGANYDFKYYWCSDVVFSAGADNAKLYTFKAGTYTFTLKISTMELTIGFPPTAATSVSVSQYEYATLYSDKALDVPNEVEAFVVTGHEGIRLTLEPIYRIPANTGVLLHAPQGTYNFYEGDGRYIDPVAVNLLKGSVADELIDNSLIHYVLSYNNDFQVGFYWPFGTGATQGVGAFTNNAGKAYLELPDQPASVIAIQGFTFVNTTDSTTGLEDVTTEGESVKVLRNGMLLIIHNGQVFNAQGARVQ